MDETPTQNEMFEDESYEAFNGLETTSEEDPKEESPQ